MVFLFLFLLAIVVIPNTDSSTCPCIDAPIESEYYNTQRILNITTNPLVLCIQNAQTSVRKNLNEIKLDDIRLHFINANEYQPKDCNVLLNVTNELPKDQRQLCPGICRLAYMEIVLPYLLCSN
jgi:hypothetical protein